jgi:hypothetical protein
VSNGGHGIRQWGAGRRWPEEYVSAIRRIAEHLDNWNRTLIEPCGPEQWRSLTLLTSGDCSSRRVYAILRWWCRGSWQGALSDGHQPYYQASDLDLFEPLVGALRRTFPEQAERVQSNGMLGGQKTRWVCESCGERGMKMTLPGTPHAAETNRGFANPRLDLEGIVGYSRDSLLDLALYEGRGYL